MTNFEYIKSLSKEELTIWLYSIYKEYYDSPWEEWWNSNYCNKCDAEIVQVVDSNMKIPCNWCELYNKCKYFQELDSTPDSKQVIKMWLEKEIE